MNTQLARTVLDLFDIGAVKFDGFRLKLHDKNPDAPLSPIYIDLRVVRSHPSVFRDVALILGRMVVSLEPDFVADVPTAASPIVGVIAATFNIPMVTPRPGNKEHGIPTKLEGAPRSEASVVLVDDLITRADSKLEAVAILRAYGLAVENVVVLVDREQGGAAELMRHGCRLHAATTLREMLDLYVRSGRISDAARQAVVQYLSESDR